MSYVTFLHQMSSTGRLTVDPLGPLSETEQSQGDEVLATFEKRHRLDVPGVAPRFDPVAGRWAAQRLYRACQLHVSRHLGADVVMRELDGPCPGHPSPSLHYSVDLTFHFLPDLLRLATLLAPADPLVDRLRKWAVEWPLSSVGVAGLGPVKVETLIADACLLRLYADRILARKDRSRLDDPRVRQAVAEALGAHPELCPDLAEAAR